MGSAVRTIQGSSEGSTSSHNCAKPPGYVEIPGAERLEPLKELSLDLLDQSRVVLIWLYGLPSLVSAVSTSVFIQVSPMHACSNRYHVGGKRASDFEAEVAANVAEVPAKRRRLVLPQSKTVYKIEPEMQEIVSRPPAPRAGTELVLSGQCSRASTSRTRRIPPDNSTNPSHRD